MFKLFGACAILISALLISLEIKHSSEKRVLQCRELLRLISYAEARLKCYLSPVCEWCVGFSSDVLSECGVIIDGKLATAEEIMRSRSLLLMPDERRVLCDFLSSVGCEYAEAELRRTAELESYFSGVVAENEREVPRRVKCFAVILVAISLGLVILMI